MAEDSQQKQPKVDRAQERAADRGSQSSPEKAPDEVRFSVDDLLENPRLIGSNSRAVAGAFAGVSQKTFTLDEARERVAGFLDREEARA